MSTSESNLNFFSPVDELKKVELLEFLVHNQTPAVLKLKSLHYKTKFIKKRSDSDLGILPFSHIPYPNEKIICSFEIGEDRYFFKTKVSADLSEAWMTSPDVIFQLQRRNDFRVNVPLTQSYDCKIIRVNARVEKFKVEIRDLSLGGCQIAIDPTVLTVKEGYSVEISLKMHQFEADLIKCEARHIKEIPGSKIVLIGLRFIETSAEFLTELQGLLVYLDRLRRGKKYD